MNQKEIAAICRSPEEFVRHFKTRLQKHVPRTYAYRNDVQAIAAAVLFPFYFKNGEAHLLLTKRTDKVEHHKNQISLPGGRRDPEDPDLRHTALRETYEEVGIAPQDIQLLGQTDRFLTNTHYLVTPFVGFFNYPYAFTISKDEIDYLIEVPLLHLLNDAHYETRISEQNGTPWLLHYYHYGAEVIWGVTGFLLSNLFSIVFELDRNRFMAEKERT